MSFGKRKAHEQEQMTIRGQIMFAFIFVTSLVVIMCFIANTAFLQRFYTWNKIQSIRSAYESFNRASNSGILTEEEFEVEWTRICNNYNINVIILDADSQTVKTSSNETTFLIRELLDYFFGYVSPDNELNEVHVLSQSEMYTLQLVNDARMNAEFLEMWGMLDNGNPFLIRSPIESIQESVSIANRFLLYVGTLAILFGAVLAGITSTRITRPICKLTEISERMSHLDFDVKYQGNDTREIARLGKNMNELSNALERTISELKTANNELLRDIEHKEKTDEMRREFLSNVSHELKTPIALIQGYAEGLKEGINEDPEGTEFYCDVIMDESAKMNNMVKKILTLNQLEFGDDPVSVERFDIVTLVKNYLQTADILIRQHEANVRMDDYPTICVWADEFKIEEVFMNYFTNALNHLGGDKIIDVKIEQKDKTVRVSVFNTGDPIPEESLPHLFEKFYKVDKARTREYGGSGVGLSIVKAIMDSLHQDYGVLNYDNGVEFWFELDMQQQS
ncbi:MAG: HAMP domain-containing histidine kinase [Lachnospiraceae bacterium]|nr:HAMP domain-containing histidine kinase [Lachnospiraceae bacterium]